MGKAKKEERSGRRKRDRRSQGGESYWNFNGPREKKKKARRRRNDGVK